MAQGRRTHGKRMGDIKERRMPEKNYNKCEYEKGEGRKESRKQKESKEKK